MKNTVSILFGTLMLSACYSDIDLSEYQEAPVVVLNCLANSDTTLLADISTTWPYTDSKRTDDIMGLAVEMTVNGEPRGMMTYSDGMYRSDVRPQPGDRIEFRTVVDGRELSAQDVIPDAPEITEVELTHRRVATDGSIITGPDDFISQSNYNEEFTYHITIKNDPAVRRYYFLRIKEADYRQILGDIDYSYDPVFQATMDQVNQSLGNLKVVKHFGLPFTNEGMTGNEYTLTVKETGAPFDYNGLSLGGNDRIIILYAISKAYYKYMTTMMANDPDATWQGKMTEFGLAEPTKVYSNIQGGTGILGCIVPLPVRVTLGTNKMTSEN